MNSENIALLQVKENQKNLLKHCQKIAKNSANLGECCVSEKRHGRREKRLTQIFSYQPIKNGHWDNFITTVIQVDRERWCYEHSKKALVCSRETSFYVCTERLSVQAHADAIRSHWAIENSNHHVRDVSLGEDASRIRINPDIFCTLRSFALNLLRINNVSNIRSARYQNALSLQTLLSYQSIS